MTGLRGAIALQPTGEHRYSWSVPPGFGQGKATFGGLVLGAIVASMKRHTTRPLRSLQAELLAAPQAGPTDIELRLLRKTGTTETFVAELRQDGQLTTHAVGIFGDARPVSDKVRPTRVLPAEWESVKAMPLGLPFTPEFTQHFEYRTITSYPFSGGAEPIASGWVRARDVEAPRDEVLLTMLADAWWLAAFIPMKQPRPGVTLTFALDVHDGFEGLPPDAPFYHHGSLVAQTDGDGTENRELWGVDGRLMCVNRQLIVIVK